MNANEPCPFGYWVGPEGEIYGLGGWQQHSEMASAILESGALGLGTAPFFNLSFLGWIAVTVDKNLSTPSFSLPGEIEWPQAKALLKIIGWHSPTRFFVTHEECSSMEAAQLVRAAVKTR